MSRSALCCGKHFLRGLSLPLHTRGLDGTDLRRLATMRNLRESTGLQIVRRAKDSRSKAIREVEDDTPENAIFTRMIVKAGESSDWGAVMEKFDKVQTKNTIVYNAAIAAARKCGCPAEGLVLFKRMQQAGVHVTPITLHEIIKTLGVLRRYDEAKQVWDRLKAIPHDQGAVSYTKIIGAAAAVGNVDDAFALMQSMADGRIDVQLTHYGGVMNACKSAQDSAAALRLLAKMRKARAHPNIIVYTSAMAAHRRAGLMGIRSLVRAMQRDGVRQDKEGVFLEEHIASLVGAPLQDENLKRRMKMLRRDRLDDIASALAEAKQTGVHFRWLTRRAKQSVPQLW